MTGGNWRLAGTPGATPGLIPLWSLRFWAATVQLPARLRLGTPRIDPGTGVASTYVSDHLNRRSGFSTTFPLGDYVTSGWFNRYLNRCTWGVHVGGQSQAYYLGQGGWR